MALCALWSEEPFHILSTRIFTGRHEDKLVVVGQNSGTATYCICGTDTGKEKGDWTMPPSMPKPCSLGAAMGCFKYAPKPHSACLLACYLEDVGKTPGGGQPTPIPARSATSSNKQILEHFAQMVWLGKSERLSVAFAILERIHSESLAPRVRIIRPCFPCRRSQHAWGGKRLVMLNSC